MHWLQTLDTNLFLFVNRSLVNPVFDWLMPILSGNSWFIPLAVAVAFAALCFGNARSRICVLMLILAVALGDSLVINTIKHVAARPRPFVTLPEARLFGTIGKGYVPPSDNGSDMNATAIKSGHDSMPSSHAANWFAMTMVMFLFYRRSLWFMLPLALGVSFSRIYNGVHYPSDVMTGAILGAGYAAAGIFLAQSLWNCLGGKFFPRWHEQLPSLLKPEVGSQKPEVISPPAQPSTFNLQPSTTDDHWLRLGCFLIFAMLIGRWIYLASGTIDLEKDEAYQWLWSKHLALSFISKPLGIAMIQFIGTHIFGDTPFGIRFFSPLFAAILSLMTLRFIAREIGARPAFWLLLVVNATPLLGIGTILMTIDPPLVLCWMWALIAGWRAAQPGGKTCDWLIVGLAMGLGFLCKYTAAVQLVCWIIFFALAPAARIHLRKPGPWLALVIFGICTTPVIIWNAQHGWATVTHVAGNAGMNSQWHPTLRYFWDFLFTQAGLLNPIFFIGAMWATFGFWKFRRERPLWLFFFCMSAPLFFGYWLYSFHSRIQPNWPVAAVPPMFCLMVVYWNEKFRAGSRWVKPLFTIGLAFGFFALPLMYETNLIGKIAGHPLPAEKDPLRRVRAWPATAALVETAREKLATEGKPAFIIAADYSDTGMFSFYTPQARATLKTGPLVYCIDSDMPVNQFYFWPDYDYRAHRKGQNAIFAQELDTYPLESGWLWKWLARKPVNYAALPPPLKIPARLTAEFESVTNLGAHEILFNGRVFRRMNLWACYNLK